jgi:hypothetical protein
VAAAVALAALAVHLPALANGYVSWDDTLYVFENPRIASLDAEFFRWAFLDFHAAYWAPLTWLSYALEHAAFGLHPAGYHLTNVVLHAANSLVFVLVSARALALVAERGEGASFLDRSTIALAAGVAGLVFALHPLRVESVAWIAERKGLLSSLFVLLGLHAYLGRKVPGPDAPRVRWDRGYVLALLCFALALMSKPTAVTVPVALLVLDAYPRGAIRSRASLGAAALEKVPFLVGSVLSTWMSVRAATATAPMLTLDELPFSTRLLVSATNMVVYLAKTLWPGHLVPFYPYPSDVALGSLEYALPLLLVLGASIASFVAARRRPLWAAAWGWYVLTLLPVVGLTQAGAQVRADRFTYLPALAPSLLAGLGAAWAWRRTATLARGRAIRAAGIAAAALLAAVVVTLTVRQIGVWKDDLTLWSYVIDREPTVYFAYSNRAMVYRGRGEPARALQDLDRAIALNRDDDVVLVNRGLVLMQVGEVARGLDDLGRACELGNAFACGTVRFQRAQGR